jgi:hypothetical protein|tara:strand:- start:44 stop:220 length:177 start_codon:yes stop_codon:yes gene_type:complete
LNKNQVEDDENELNYEYDRKRMYLDVRAKLESDKTGVYKMSKRAKAKRTGGGYNPNPK